MNIKVVIIGAGGHGRVVADIVRANNDIVVGFLDDAPYEDILGPVSDMDKYLDFQFVVAIGNSAIREKFSNFDCKYYTAIHPSAIISPSVKIGEGTVVMPNAVINADAVIGKQCIINTASVIEHDNHIGDFAHVSVGAKLGGTVNIGKHTWIGIGSTVSNNITICDNCMIGAGAVVLKDINKSGTYVGVPARRIKE